MFSVRRRVGFEARKLKKKKPHTYTPIKCTVMYSLYFTIHGTKILNLLCLIICAKHWDFYLFVFVTVWKKYSNNDKKNPINLLNNNAFFLLSSGLFSDIER